MIDYSNSFIYKICCKDPTIEDIYIGSTTNLSRRLHQHKHNCIKPQSKKHNQYKYQFIRENGGWENWELVLIEPVDAKNKMDLKRIERHYVETYKSTLNKCVPARTRKETNDAYRLNNKEKIKLQQKKYRENNKEKLKERRKIYYEKKKLEKNSMHSNNNELHNSNSIAQKAGNDTEKDS